MIDKIHKGNYYKTFVIKLKAFLSYCFKREYIEVFEIKIPNVLLEKKAIYTETEIQILLKKPNLKECPLCGFFLFHRYRNIHIYGLWYVF